MKAMEQKERSRGAIVRRFKRDEDGATAVEFALIALPFFALLFAIMEAALVFWTGQVLEEAVTQASRTLYTGGFQQSMLTTAPADVPGKLKDELCKQVKGLFKCSDIKVDVQTSTFFPNGVKQPIVTDSEGKRRLDPAFGQYNKPLPYQITLVRAVIEYPVYMPLLGANTSNLSGGKRLIMGSAVFRTEQYL
jgi:Flp pilus assembly protein TadG